jgi:cysteine desulfurase
MFVYLDNSSTTKVDGEVAVAVVNSMDCDYGNPSSVHTLGQNAERIMKNARKDVAALIGGKPQDIVFTGSGTEADNLAVHSAFRTQEATGGRRFILSAIEHPAIIQPAIKLASLGADVVFVPVREDDGTVDLDFLEAHLNEDTVLVSVMHVNNELGAIQPLRQIGESVRKTKNRWGGNPLFHTDAIQSYGKIPLYTESEASGMPDLVSISAHKIYGPKGVGALWARNPGKLDPITLGGGQEDGLRSGTENVPGIAGFGKAAELLAGCGAKEAAEAERYRSELLAGIKSSIKDVRVNSPEKASVTGEAGCSSPYILSVSFLGTRGEVLVHDLEQSEIYVSTGSACSNLGKKNSKVNSVLAAAGLSAKEAEGTIRFSIGRFNEISEIDYVLEKLKASVEKIRRIGSYR